MRPVCCALPAARGCSAQVFYAFVLGTLLHYLVRTDESTVHFNELMKAVDDYVTVGRRSPRGFVRACAASCSL